MSNNWNGKGLPPVGDTIEYAAIDFDFAKPAIENGKWYRGTIIAYYDGFVWTSDNGIRAISNTAFRPIKSDRDKAIEEIADIWLKTQPKDDDSMGCAFAVALYDAGYRKQSGE